MDKILLIVGLLTVVAIVATGGFGIFAKSGLSEFGGFDLFSGGPKASGPGSWFSGENSFVESGGRALPPSTTIAPAKPASAGSQYKGKVRINSVSRPGSGTTKPDSEYVLISYSNYGSKDNIVITGWSVENTQGKRYFVEDAARIPLVDAYKTTAVISPGGQAYIHTGSSPIGIGFRENACTGYLNENQKFIPSLSGGCPRISVSKLVQYNDRCLAFMEKWAGACRLPVLGGQDSVGIEDSCSDFIVKNFNYRGCVDNFREADDFYRNTWHLYLKRTEKLWRNLHDIITLRDAEGLVVDTYQY